MTDKEKIKELLVGMANSEWCDNAAKRKIHNDILPLIDSLPEKPELTKFETELLSIMAEYGVEKASDDDIRREANRLLKIARSSTGEWNEEDSRILGNLKSELTNLVARGLIKRETEDKYVSWLDSLRPQNRWRPSKAQMKALYDSIPENVMEISEREMLLNSLYKDLRNLTD